MSGLLAWKWLRGRENGPASEAAAWPHFGHPTLHLPDTWLQHVWPEGAASGGGCAAIEVAAVQCNVNMEDRHAEGVVGDEWLMAAVFDGHSGWRCADAVSSSLGGYLDRALRAEGPSEAAIKRAFLTMDYDITEVAVDLAQGVEDNVALRDSTVAAALSGACGCVFLSNADVYLVGNTGDCRAVLGVSRGAGAWGAMPLSQDQTAETPSEVTRIRRQHPGEEETCVRRGRVLGRLQPSRSFGDAKYKWPRKRGRQLGAKKIKEYFTPPYVTAEPAVTELDHHQDDRFVVLATDGLWDVVSSHDAVTVVGQHLDSHHGDVKGAANALVAAALQRSVCRFSCANGLGLHGPPLALCCCVRCAASGQRLCPYLTLRVWMGGHRTDTQTTALTAPWTPYWP